MDKSNYTGLSSSCWICAATHPAANPEASEYKVTKYGAFIDFDSTHDITSVYASHLETTQERPPLPFFCGHRHVSATGIHSRRKVCS